MQEVGCAIVVGDVVECCGVLFGAVEVVALWTSSAAASLIKSTSIATTAAHNIIIILVKIKLICGASLSDYV